MEQSYVRKFLYYFRFSQKIAFKRGKGNGTQKKKFFFKKFFRKDFRLYPTTKSGMIHIPIDCRFQIYINNINFPNLFPKNSTHSQYTG